MKQSLNEVASFMIGVAQEHALALCSFRDFDNNRKATDRFDGVFDVRCISNVDSPWNRNLVSSEQL